RDQQPAAVRAEEWPGDPRLRQQLRHPLPCPCVPNPDPQAVVGPGDGPVAVRAQDCGHGLWMFEWAYVPRGILYAENPGDAPAGSDRLTPVPVKAQPLQVPR